MAMESIQQNGYTVQEELLNKGQNSKIFSVISSDGEDYVIKVKDDPDVTKIKFMFQEREILTKLKGQEVIINLENVFIVTQIFYCFKLCKYHDLESFLTSGFARHVRQPTINNLCKQLCEALKFVHENGIIHGEIHPKKILVHNKYTNDEKILLFDIKLAGFSQAIFVDRVSEIPSVKELVNQPMLYSPERMAETYCQAGDVWATGILLFQLAWGYMPFKGDDINELAENILNTEFDSRKESDEEGPWFSTKIHPLDDFGKQLIGNMLQHKIEDRYTANECLEHTWLNGNRQSWLPLLNLFNEVKTTTENLKLNFHIGSILSFYLPKRTVDIVKDFQHIYLNRKTDNGKIQTSVEFQTIIEQFGGKLSTEQTEKIFNTLNAYENGVGANEILSAIAIDYMCKNDDIKMHFCDILEDICDENHFEAKANHIIECKKKEITKEFAELESHKILEQFTVELFGFHADNHKRITKELDNEIPLIPTEIISDGADESQPKKQLSYLRLSTRDIKINNNVSCDEDMAIAMVKQEKEGQRTIFSEREAKSRNSIINLEENEEHSKVISERLERIAEKVREEEVSLAEIEKQKKKDEEVRLAEIGKQKKEEEEKLRKEKEEEENRLKREEEDRLIREREKEERGKKDKAVNLASIARKKKMEEGVRLAKIGRQKKKEEEQLRKKKEKEERLKREEEDRLRREKEAEERAKFGNRIMIVPQEEEDEDEEEDGDDDRMSTSLRDEEDEGEEEDDDEEDGDNDRMSTSRMSTSRMSTSLGDEEDEGEEEDDDEEDGDEEEEGEEEEDDEE